MADPRHGSYKDLVQAHGKELDVLLRQGIYKPVFVYHILIFHFLPIIGLIIPRSRATRYVRPGIFVVCLGVSIETLKSHRTLLGGNGYMIGLMTAWWLVWTATLFMFTDLERDFQRIERGSATDHEPDTSSSLPEDTKSNMNSILANGQRASPVSGKKATRSTSTIIDCAKQRSHNTFHWQSYPRKFRHRLDWCAGLLFNLRGPEWNWRAPRLGPLPRSVHAQLDLGFDSNQICPENDGASMSPRKTLESAFYMCLQSYLLLDFLKVVMMRDPYFRGYVSSELGPPFPFSCLIPFPVLVNFYRYFLSATGVYVALNFVTSFNPICFLGLSLAFPNASRRLTAAPLDESWLYSDNFGPIVFPVLNYGLAGCWGRWWHQLFRYGFTASARWVLSLLPTSVSDKPHIRRIVHLVVAFALSGFIHSCGSFTQFTATQPLSGPFLFFSLQCMAIFLESVFKSVIVPRTPLARVPRWLGQTANAFGVIMWFLYSGGFIADDFARGGLWLMEPVPISPLRGLGLARDKGWWCWDLPWFGYWSDGTYWGSGIRVI
ncbi:hypothetical protein N7462_003523 [Penicillium macrosclerotiorum]|uniref:uncharacterized protein n=1 Tax=Penicillium macrosclerotiorum TaxID=303699 RepID=UPI0025466C53|nr:uncharacterized protein N7462_003523 [Penicillium macrosclerotiorum]KAJ5689131.1 hypothetical protein N7462_003523 [Penicillium macrosclerotiorum]